MSSVDKPFAEVDLNIIMKDVLEKFKPEINETGAVIHAGHLPVITGIKSQIEQLFHHLLSNALKFRSQCTPEINLTLKKENNFWVIAVKDNGIGIDPAYFEKIFIIFRRLHTDETKYSGAGMGLAVCKKIIELHGGSIWVESAVDKGSTFYFTLPV